MKILSVIIIFAVPLLIHGQPGFEGIIEYQVTYSGNPENLKPGTMSFSIQGGDLMIRTDIPGLPASRILFKTSDNSVYMIDDSSKNVIRISISSDEKNKRIGEVPEEYRKEYEGALDEINDSRDSLGNKFELTGETSRIAGYDCRKYKVVNSDGKTEAYAWFAMDLQIKMPKSIGDNTGILRGLLTGYGFPLRIENLNNEQGRTQNMTLEAKKVLRTSLDPGIFLIPEGYHVEDLFGNFR